MRASLCRLAANVALLGLASAQTTEPQDGLEVALLNYPDLSLFRSLLGQAPESLENVLSDDTNNITVLVPTNEAINAYLTASGLSNITELKSDDIETFFSYQILAVSLKGADFDDPNGMTVPTLLQGDKFNNRSAGPMLEQQYGERATGQVVFATHKDKSARRVKRQDAGPVVNIRAGLAQDVGMTAVDVKWGTKGINTFQVVDSVLVPPKNCSTTIRSFSDDRLTSMDDALKKSGLWPRIDTSSNVTCLAPSTEAFKNAGDPQVSGSKSEVGGVVLHHTLGQVAYSNFLEDGMVFESLNNTKITVTFKGDDIYFNNAKLIEANVLTNNGLLHILDSVIETDNSVSGKSSGTSSTSAEVPSGTSTEAPSSTSSSASSASETNAANALAISYSGVVAVAAGFLLL
ncbi:hypothetical protein G7Z17_g3465 [Cylindrodendrum hubeiense]|uniref:FAS1 domain-containing protein n=1 Tax=Cylindrodendrum hubeiense TaxID=595255 RepID=A0A9P5HAV9_9HYPO|nr:hypothetical protein G7Z17_g3465 [Cylindrodendrum hubeiense]